MHYREQEWEIAYASKRNTCPNAERNKWYFRNGNEWEEAGTFTDTNGNGTSGIEDRNGMTVECILKTETGKLGFT